MVLYFKLGERNSRYGYVKIFVSIFLTSPNLDGKRVYDELRRRDGVDDQTRGSEIQGGK